METRKGIAKNIAKKAIIFLNYLWRLALWILFGLLAFYFIKSVSGLIDGYFDTGIVIYLENNDELIFSFIATGLFSFFIYNYLRRSSSRRFENFSDYKTNVEQFTGEQEKNDFEKKISNEVEKRITQLQEAVINFSESDKAQVLTNIQAKLETDAIKSYVVEIHKIVASRVKEDTLEHLFARIIARLRSEIDALTARGNLNLSLGMTTTIVGIAILGSAVLNFPTEDCSADSNENCTEILFTYFLPRFSLVILIEIFAYFFLRLYKQSLEEIKYFQNEITNIEAKQLALQLAMHHDDQALRIKVAEELAKTERNFILEKDQSTVEIEREKLANNNHSNLINALKDIVNHKRGD